jgi:hypothetical protein
MFVPFAIAMMVQRSKFSRCLSPTGRSLCKASSCGTSRLCLTLPGLRVNRLSHLCHAIASAVYRGGPLGPPDPCAPPSIRQQLPVLARACGALRKCREFTRACDSKCAGRPARSRWCKSTTMKE